MFTDSQNKALREIQEFLTDKIQTVHCLSGSPGTGKSYLINNAIIPLAEAEGWEIVVTATTNKAASILQGTTLCKAYGIALQANEYTGQQEYNTKNAKKLADSLVIIDEASMLDKMLWNIVIGKSIRCKFLLVGDQYQLPAVKGGFDAFGTYPVSMLTEVVRQKDAEFLNQISKMKEGVVNKKVTLPKECNSVKYVTLSDKAEVQKVLKQFTENDKILCYTNDAVKAYIKNMRKLQGKPDEIQEGDPVSARNFVESVNLNTHTYADEELIMGDMSEPYIAEIQGSLGNYSLKARDITFRNKSGKFRQFTDYKEWNALLKKLAALKDWRAYYKVKEGFVDIRSSEACTVHCSQGSTYDYVFIDLDDIMTCRQISVKTRLLYVAVSRAKKGVYIYHG